MASLPMVASGGGIDMPIFEVVVPAANTRAYGSLMWLDVSNYNTLTIGRIYKNGNGNITNTQFQIRNYTSGGSTYSYLYNISDNEQTFDISTFNELTIVCDFKSNTAWTSLRYDGIKLS